MIIQELISAKVAQMTSNGDSFTFLHSEKDWQNLETDEAVLPSVHLDMPVKVQTNIVMGGAIEQRYICVLTFLYESNLDDNPDEQYANLKLAESAMNQFILLVEDDSDNFDTSKNVFGEAYQVIAYPVYDRCVDGIILPFTCVPRNRPDVCIPSYSLPIDDCDPATVQSSGANFSQLIPSGDTFTLPDVSYSFTNSEATVIASGTAEAQSDIVGVLPDITFTDSDGTTSQQPSAKDLVCTPNPAFVTLVDFLTLSSNNPFGNTNRFTDELGTQVYANDIMINWDSFNPETGEVNGFRRSILFDTYANLQTQIAALTVGGFTGWIMGTDKEYIDICKTDDFTSKPLEYSPMNNSTGSTLYTSTQNGTLGNVIFNTTFSVSSQNLIASRMGIPMRVFTWNGSALT